MAKASITSENGRRVSAIIIRASTDPPDKQTQIGNVREMLKAECRSHPEDGPRFTVADADWFVYTSPRSDVLENPEFRRLLDRVKRNEIDTIFVESFTRLGTNNVQELIPLLGTLVDHDTRLYDLTAKRELTDTDLPTTIINVVGMFASVEERENKGRDSLRGRVDLFKTSGTWPTGRSPFGYGKQLWSADGGTIQWQWIPTERSRGQLWEPDTRGKLVRTKTGVRLPPKERHSREITRLVPGLPEHVKAVRLIFELFTRAGLSRRAISARLNETGHKLYGRPFTHAVVTSILRNVAYVGDIAFGKKCQSKHFTCDSDGLLHKVKLPKGVKKLRQRRPLGECMIQKGTHEPLIDRKVWDRAQAKLDAEVAKGKKSYIRNPAYYLRGIFHCKHCGKAMTGRTHIHPTTGARTRCYVCASYVQGWVNGHPTGCKYYRLTHADAEKEALAELKRRKLDLDGGPGEGMREAIDRRRTELDGQNEDAREQALDWAREGVDAFVDYVREAYNLKGKVLSDLHHAAHGLYGLGWHRPPKQSDLPMPLAKFKKAVVEAERVATAKARKQLAALEREHATLTREWARATERMQGVLRADIDQLEADIARLKPRTVPLSERLSALREADSERYAEMKRLTAEYQGMDGPSRGEALRRLLGRAFVTWKTERHQGKTARKGRDRNRVVKIDWENTDSHVGASSRTTA
jgi:hypothetical protein